MRIANSNKVSHMLCWFYYIDLYGRFFWRYIGRSDIRIGRSNIRIGSNRLQSMESKKREDEVELGD